jgi:hypothetical protein
MGAEGPWSRQRKKNVNGQIGEFCRHIVAKLFNCKVTDRRDEKNYADAFSEPLGVRLEVKARGNTDAFGLDIDQLLRHGGELPPNIQETLYALVAYKNRERIKRGQRKPSNIEGEKVVQFSPLVRFHTKEKRISYVAERFDEIYILDVDLVWSLLRICNTRERFFAGDGGQKGSGEKRSALVLNRTFLRSTLRDSNLSEVLSKVRLGEKGWVRTIIPISTSISFEGRMYPIECSMILILRKRTYDRIISTIREHSVVKDGAA